MYWFRLVPILILQLTLFQGVSTQTEELCQGSLKYGLDEKIEMDHKSSRSVPKFKTNICKALDLHNSSLQKPSGEKEGKGKDQVPLASGTKSRNSRQLDVDDKKVTPKQNRSRSRAETNILPKETNPAENALRNAFQDCYGKRLDSLENMKAVSTLMCKKAWLNPLKIDVRKVTAPYVSSNAREEYTECLLQDSLGLKVKTERDEQSRHVKIGVRYVGSPGSITETTLMGVFISPPDAFQCEGFLWKFKDSEAKIGNEVVDLYCNRTIFPSAISYLGDSVLAVPSSITIMTSVDAITRNFQAIYF